MLPTANSPKKRIPVDANVDTRRSNTSLRRKDNDDNNYFNITIQTQTGQIINTLANGGDTIAILKNKLRRVHIFGHSDGYRLYRECDSGLLHFCNDNVTVHDCKIVKGSVLHVRTAKESSNAW